MIYKNIKNLDKKLEEKVDASFMLNLSGGMELKIKVKKEIPGFNTTSKNQVISCSNDIEILCLSYKI